MCLHHSIVRKRYVHVNNNTSTATLSITLSIQLLPYKTAFSKAERAFEFEFNRVKSINH